MNERAKRIDSVISADDMFQLRPARTLFASGKFFATVRSVIISVGLLSVNLNGVIRTVIQTNGYDVGKLNHQWLTCI